MNRTSSINSPRSFSSPSSTSSLSSYAVFLNNSSFNPKLSNKISTSKYQWYSFLPKMLMEQFTRMANAYFLIIAILQSEKAISYSNGTPVILLPLCFVILINGLKDLFEDTKRKKSDTSENTSLCQVFNKQSKSFISKKWKDLSLGDIVKVENNTSFPADLLLLNSSDPSGSCRVETTNIDGETSLKYRIANTTLVTLTRNEEELSKFNYVCITKEPNEFIYQFEGVLYKNDENGNVDDYEEFIYVDKDSFLLRGCYLKETEYIIGSVIYVGHDTKTLINSPIPRAKISTLERVMNYQIVIIFLLQLILSSICASIYVLRYVGMFDYLKMYIFINNDNVNNDISIWTQFPTSMGIWILLFTNFVPISLLVTLESVKFFQAYFIGCDVDMYDKERNIGTTVQSSTLNEELGQVKYVFTDKTGTLTKNNMKYKCISINGKIYEDRISIINDINKNDVHSTRMKMIIECICLCNSVITDYKKYIEKNEIEYHASSPDEKALVCFAKEIGFILKERRNDKKVVVQIEKEDVVFEVLNVLEYNSERKRMGVIVKTYTGKIIYYVKGADSTIMTLLSKKDSNNNIIIKETQLHIDEFAIKGYRTLMFAFKELSLNEYNTFITKYKQITTSLNKLDTDIDDLYSSLIEHNLNLLGVTAIEDELADNVSSTISSLLSTGIKIWMLTGDKLDTAKNIAYSCNLFHKSTYILSIPEHSSTSSIHSFLTSHLSSLSSISSTHIALLISGTELSLIFSNPFLLEMFFKTAIRCKTVICSRVSPKQKAEMVSLIQNNERHAITLAIGDGANDVSMITEAHIGIGIKGKEGTQAARASDYAICEFQYMKHLLFYHGREAYRKNAYCVCYNFYKNFLLVSPQLWNGIFNLYSGQSIYEAITYQLFNLLFTSIPIGWYAVFDFEMDRSKLIQNERFYIQGIYGKLFHYKRFWKWLGLGGMQGLVIVIICIEVMNNNDANGYMIDNWVISTMVFEIIVIIANMKITMDSYEHTWISVILQWMSIGLFYIVVYMFSQKGSTIYEMYGHIQMVVLDLKCCVCIIEICLFLLMVDYFIQKVTVYYGCIIEGDKLPPYKRTFTKDEEILFVNDKNINEKLISN